MTEKEQAVIDILCGETQKPWTYCDASCSTCKFYHEESDMGARVSICTHGLGKSKDSCHYYMTRHEYFEFVRSAFANLKTENAKLRELVRDLMPIVCEGCHERLCEMPKEEHPFVECLFDYRMRELGIEVDDA